MEVEIVEIDAACRYKKHLTSHWVPFNRTAPPPQSLTRCPSHSLTHPLFHSQHTRFRTYAGSSYRSDTHTTQVCLPHKKRTRLVSLWSSQQPAAGSWQLAAGSRQRCSRRSSRHDATSTSSSLLVDLLWRATPVRRFRRATIGPLCKTTAKPAMLNCARHSI